MKTAKITKPLNSNITNLDYTEKTYLKKADAEKLINKQEEQDTKINENKVNIQNLNTNKQDILNNNTLEIKPRKINFGDDITLYKYSNNELVVNYNEKLSFIDKNDNRITFLQNGVIDGYYKNNEILNSATKITELGNNKVMVITQADIRNNLGAGADLYQNLPETVKNLRNVNNIEYFEYNFVKSENRKNIIYTNNVGNISATVYSNRIYLKNENNIPNFIEYIRFKLIYDKK